MCIHIEKKEERGKNNIAEWFRKADGGVEQQSHKQIKTKQSWPS